VAERVRGETDRHDPAGMGRPPDRDLTVFLYQRMRDYYIGMISSRWWAKGANVCGAGGL
jgi:hypothetical protein